MKKTIKFCVISVLLMLLNIIVLFTMNYFVGGNATNGKIEAGVYYVMDYEGDLKEVSKNIFIFSYVFSCITTLSILIGFPSILILQFKAANSPFMKGHRK